MDGNRFYWNAQVERDLFDHQATMARNMVNTYKEIKKINIKFKTIASTSTPII